MADILDDIELAGLRIDFEELLGERLIAGEEDISGAGTLVMVRRVIDKGPINPDTGRYDSPTIDTIYSGAAHISPVTYRRDRQETAGEEAVRIRQYRMVLPWDSGDIHLKDFTVVVMSQDPEMEGRIFDVSDVLYESELAARRISLVDTAKDFDPFC